MRKTCFWKFENTVGIPGWGCRDADMANIRIFARNFIYDETKEKGERTMSKELMNTTEMKEVISKRTACMKVFEHADHRFTAAIYGTPVHYMKDGRWEEIDNRLEAVADVDEEEIADGAANKNSDAETAALQAAEGV